MKKEVKKALFGVAIIILFTAIGTGQATTQETLHYIIVGHVYDNNGNLVEHVEITLLNLRTNEVQICMTNAKGEYIFDCANFKHGFENNDTLNISSIHGGLDVVIDMRHFGIQSDINRPEDKEVDPIIPGMILVSAAGGLYYYLKRKKRTEKTDK